MFEKPQSPHVLGLDIDAFSLKGVLLTFNRNKLKLEKTLDVRVEQQSNDENVKPLYISNQKSQLDALTENQLIVTSANTQDILIRPLELKLTKDHDIDAALPFQTEPLIPYPIENAIIDKVLLSKDKGGSRLTVFSIRKDHLNHHLSIWNSLDIEPEVISAAPQALVLFANQFLNKETPFFILHLGIENSFGVLVDQKKLIAAQAIPVGLSQLIDILCEDNTIDKTTALEKLLKQPLQHSLEEYPSLKSHVEELRMVITRTLYSLAKQFKGKEIGELLVTGTGATILDLPEALCSALNKTILIPNENPDFGANQKELLNFALPIGEALSVLPGCNDQVNFRQNDFIYPEPWKRLKQPITHYFILCLGIAAALFLFGKAYASYQEGELRQQYLNLLRMMNKPYESFEKDLSSKIPNTTSATIPSVADLSLEDLKIRLNFLEKEIQSTPQTFPLQPNVPLVSDVLAWISSHPNFISQQGENLDASKSMQIQSFNYAMVKRPDPTKKQERYQVKVEMEFSTPTPKMAREFHDALITPNDMVDPKGEIKWNSNKDLYRTSFYLKDKTVYPNL